MKTIIVKNYKIKFMIYNPGGNITALVINDNYDKIFKQEINNTILYKFNFIEQVGFISNNYLEMAGGEFCINASRCAIYHLSTINKKLVVNILDKKIKGKILNNNIVSISYQINKNIDSLITNNKEYSIVNLDGINLIFLDEFENNILLNKITDKDIFTKVKNKIMKFNINSKAIGIVLTNKNNIYPFIWVKEIDTLLLETACGSASVAYSLLNYKKTKNCDYVINQPSGYSVNIKLTTNKNVIKNIKFNGFVEEYKERR